MLLQNLECRLPRPAERSVLAGPAGHKQYHHWIARFGARCQAALSAAVIGVLINLNGTFPAIAGTVSDWNTLATDYAAALQNPATQTHTLAIIHIAIHDALNAIDAKYTPYIFRDSAPQASVDAAVAAAARNTLVPLIPDAADAIAGAYNDAIATIADGPAKAAGLALGEASAAAILKLRQTDNLITATTQAYTPGSAGPGVYQLTPPLNFVILAGWGELPLFSQVDTERFRSEPPYRIKSVRYARDYFEVKALGALESKQRTEQQTATARFWYDVATKEWHRAAQSALAEVAADEWRTARTLALLSIAMADGGIASMDTKFAYNFWRPVTAIRAGDDDGNRFTPGHRHWEPLCVTPPFPEHNSTHAVTAAAAATVLASEFGDRHVFTVDSPTGQSRTYHRFSTAAYEEAVSRIYCGIHFRHGLNVGLAQGKSIAHYARQHVLKPVVGYGR